LKTKNFGAGVTKKAILFLEKTNHQAMGSYFALLGKN
jgi:hypothetical protein